MLATLRTKVTKSLTSFIARSKSSLAGAVAVQTPKKSATVYQTTHQSNQLDFKKSPFQVLMNGAQNLHQVAATPRQLCDMELLANGGFEPLTGFMNRQEYQSVVDNVRMPSGQLWPIPIYFDVDAQTKEVLEKTGKKLLITDRKGRARAVLHVSDIWEPNKEKEGVNVYGGCEDHCEIININTNIKQYYVGGQIEMIDQQSKDEWAVYKRTPQEVKKFFQENKWEKIVAFQTRNPMHNAHIQLTHRAASILGAKLFLNPVVGPTKPGDIDYKTRMKCYQAIIGQYPKDSVLLSTLPLAMRMGGPREAMLHAIIRKNYGCTHFIVGRDHAGPGSDSSGKDIYGPYEARDFVMRYKEEIGIQPVPFEEMVYIQKEKKFFPVSQTPKDVKPMKLSGTQVRRRLKSGEDIPSWFSPQPVVKILRKNAQQMTLNSLCIKYANSHPSVLIKKALEMYGDDIAISFSGAQDVILIEYAKQSGLPFRVFSLDTGRLHHQTYEFYEMVEKHYGINIQYTFPDSEAVQELVKQKGMFSFYNDGHQECCGVRKVEPLKKKLGELKAWITGVRKDQSQTRTELKLVHFDKAFKGQNNGDLVKFNPLSNMKGKDLWQEINELDVPYNPLHNKGFVSIGCQPCTRPVNPGRHERQGRWWWQDSNTKECGLHANKGNPMSSSSSPCPKVAKNLA